MKLDTQMTYTSFNAITQAAQRFERMGFDGVWTFEAAHDPFLPLALTVAATERLEVGTNISVAFGRSPFTMAQVAWDLQQASQGRFHLGLGTQVRAHVERRFSMPFEHPAARVTDYIRCLRAIWDTFQNDAHPSYQGPFYHFKLMNPFFNPGPIKQPHIPIYLAGVNPRMCRAAGEVADGFHVHPMHSAGYLRDVVRPALDAGARLNNRTVDDIELYAPVFAVSGETQAEMDAAEQDVRQQIAFYGSTPNYRVLLEYHGYGSIGKELNDLMRKGDMAAMPKLVPDELLEQVAVVASPAQLPSKLRQRYEGVLQRVSLYFPISATEPETKWQQFAAAFRLVA
ncbi:MAG: TIGR03617 family F420-dependent LLM class oxidoreductase [bacterium]|nr:TIGR03617 family F420-dependent LLM class oxidoreductase [bacterium]